MSLLQLMSCYRSLPLAFAVTLLFISSSSSSSSSTTTTFTNATPHSHSLRAFPPSGSINERSLVEVPFGEPVETETDTSSVVPLAAQRTYRKDPLNGFKRYTGGWNIKERHYWASVGYTASPLFVIALIWFVGFGICLCIIGLCHFCCTKRTYGYSQVVYALSLVFLILFTVVAIIGCVVLYTGQEKFHKSTSQTLDYVVNQADTIVLVYILVALGWILVAGTFILGGTFLILHK
ncbi:hypothetical protein ACFE04_012391 [Oxalis oulophora]